MNYIKLISHCYIFPDIYYWSAPKDALFIYLFITGKVSGNLRDLITAYNLKDEFFLL